MTYQTTVHTYPDGRVIAFAGHFNGLMLNPMTGVVETNGTSIVDVTIPEHPVYLKHLIADKGGARMAKLCDGDDLPHGAEGHVYLLRENGAVSHWATCTPNIRARCFSRGARRTSACFCCYLNWISQLTSRRTSSNCWVMSVIRPAAKLLPFSQTRAHRARNRIPLNRPASLPKT